MQEAPPLRANILTPFLEWSQSKRMPGNCTQWYHKAIHTKKGSQYSSHTLISWVLCITFMTSRMSPLQKHHHKGSRSLQFKYLGWRPTWCYEASISALSIKHVLISHAYASTSPQACAHQPCLRLYFASSMCSSTVPDKIARVWSMN